MPAISEHAISVRDVLPSEAGSILETRARCRNAPLGGEERRSLSQLVDIVERLWLSGCIRRTREARTAEKRASKGTFQLAEQRFAVRQVDCLSGVLRPPRFGFFIDVNDSLGRDFLQEAEVAETGRAWRAGVARFC